MNLRVVFLAAGFATRLYPLTETCAKPLLEVGGEPMLTRVLRAVERVEAARDGVVVSNGKFAADFEAWATSTSSRLNLAVANDGAPDNDSRLGAIRDLALGLEHLPDGPEADGYLVLACDNLFEFDLTELARRFEQGGATQLVVREVPEPVPPGRYSEVILSGPRVTSFREKPTDPRSNLSAIACYLFPADLPARLAEYLESGGDPDAPGHLLAWWADRAPLEASRLTGRFFDIGNLADLERARSEFGA